MQSNRKENLEDITNSYNPVKKSNFGKFAFRSFVASYGLGGSYLIGYNLYEENYKLTGSVGNSIWNASVGVGLFLFFSFVLPYGVGAGRIR